MRPADVVARDLLGTRLISTVGGMATAGIVVETEAYLGASDPASHAAERIGRTRRNESMFGPPGVAYVYLIYGMHWCVNVVTGATGVPSAVLIRALEPVEGTETMRERRGRDAALCTGPARLCQALGITGELDGHSLSGPPLELRPGWSVPDRHVSRSGRVGVCQAADWPLRFYVRGHPSISTGPHP